jgi:hypothetical protein
MHRALRWAGSVALLAVVAAAWAGGSQPPGEPPKQPPKSAAEQYTALVKEFADARTAYSKAIQEAQKLLPQPPKYAAQFLKIAEDNPKDPAAVDALVWVCTNLASGPEHAKALDILLKEHADSPRLATLCAALGRTPTGEATLRTMLDKSSHRDVKGAACFYLAQLLTNNANRGRQDAELPKEAEALYERVVKEFADVRTSPRGQTLGAMAEGVLFETRHLLVGKVAPEIEGEDIDGVKFKLSDYRGKVVMIDFWGHW